MSINQRRLTRSSRQVSRRERGRVSRNFCVVHSPFPAFSPAHPPARRKSEPPHVGCYYAHLLSLFEFDLEIPQVAFQATGLLLAPGPADPKSDRQFRASEHLSCPVLGPVTGAGLDTPARACASARVEHAHLRADSVRVGGRAMERDAKASLRLLIQVQFGRRIIFGYSHVHAPVVVEISKSRPALFSIDLNAADASIHGTESSVAIPAQP